MDNEIDFKFLSNKAKEIRKKIVAMISRADVSHIGSSLSIVEILLVLYYRILKINPVDPSHPTRDKFILSKGHACPTLYAVLADRGFFDDQLLEDYCLNGSCLSGHVTLGSVPGVEASTGSLGHGLALGLGLALADKSDNNKFKTYVLLSDGECNEGSVWEAAMFASRHQLDNLIAIVDYNKLQAFGRSEEVTGLVPLKEKWESFGWAVKEVDGHNLAELEAAFSELPLVGGKPHVIIAHTVKGKGVSYMEDKLEWHYHAPQGEKYEQAMRELS